MLHLILYEPEIPQNTDNIVRTYMVTGTCLHLIQPLGFPLDEQHLKKTGMDYVKELEYTIYKNWGEFTRRNPGDNYYYMTGYDKKAPSQFDSTRCEGDIYFILDKKSTGVPRTILSWQLGYCIRLPMVASARSLDLSNCAAVVLYKALWQLDCPGLSGVEAIKGKDWLITRLNGSINSSIHGQSAGIYCT